MRSVSGASPWRRDVRRGGLRCHLRGRLQGLRRHLLGRHLAPRVWRRLHPLPVARARDGDVHVGRMRVHLRGRVSSL